MKTNQSLLGGEGWLVVLVADSDWRLETGDWRGEREQMLRINKGH